MAKRHAARKGQRSQAREERVREVAKILATYEASVFQYEAACTHGIRQKLCLAGWGWQEAHDEARSLVKAALDRLGARRPWWNEGQPDYAHQGQYRFTERTRCVRCGTHLEGHHTKFCSQLCAQVFSTNMQKLRESDEHDKIERVRFLAWS